MADAAAKPAAGETAAPGLTAADGAGAAVVKQQPTGVAGAGGAAAGGPKSKVRQRGAGQMAHNQYSYEGLDADDWQERPWVRPDVLRARDHYKALLFEGGE
jgi:hypothetical protein